MKYWILFAASAIAVICDVLWVKITKTSHISWSLTTVNLFLSNFALLLWCIAMRIGITSAVAITGYAIATTVGCSLLGYCLFAEKLTVVNVVGLTLACVSFVMIMWK